jgi:hypothetical protein
MPLCHSCAAIHVNGVLVHEAGCPEAFRDYTVPCYYCGCNYKAESNAEYHNRHRICPDCRKDV